MKLYKSLLAAMALAVSATVMTGCDEDLAVPPLSIPTTDVRANMTIADFKAKYWSTENNYCTQVGKNDDGEDIILGGRIIASDEGGNIYQNLMLQDETGAITIATLTSSNDGLSDLNTKYKVGEEMYINVTELYAGKYAGLFQIGTAGDYNGTPQTSKMAATEFLSHTYLNGLPDPSAITITDVTIAEINGFKSVADQQKYQSQIVRIEDVSFVGGGSLNWGETGSSSTAVNRYLIDKAGNRLLVRNSNKSDFCDQVLPTGHGNVVGILGYYNGTWQFLFRTPDDCTDFGGESYAPEMEGEGTAAEPFTVGGVLAGAEGSGVWVTGYIVGWVEGQVLADGAHFTTPATVASNILIAASPNETNVANCIPVQLTSGSAVRSALNLKDHADNLGKQVTIKGDLQSYFGASGIKTTTAYTWGATGDDSGTTTPDNPSNPEGPGDGSADKPFDCSQVIGGATGTGVWVTGYIVGAVNDKSISDAAFAAPFSLNTNILIAATPNETNAANCVPVQLPAGNVRTALNLVDHADLLGKQVTLKGNLEKYFGQAGIKSTSDYVMGAQGNNTPVTTNQYKKVTSITSGKTYLLVADGKMAKLNTANYGYLNVDAATISGDVIQAAAENAFTITSTTGGYTIQMSDKRYLYQTGSYNSFNFSDTAVDGSVFTITFDSTGAAKITNVSTSKWIQYSANYTSYGCYSTETGTMPTLYEKVN
ncbi:MAG: DUF6359 domain-containing protein [Bacteroides sp.]|nr:DUF6359 domain-containing protein [Bacteroides sp.]MCM1413751.1 DUF6359 domain-containing protein [Bacteroides sp.]MCM1472230.1 DUF6359 domain-containing protein [Bacteroides sp.]